MNHRFFSRFAKIRLALITSPVLIAVVAQAGQAAPAQGAADPIEIYAHASDGTALHWVVYTPSEPGPWPAVLVIHGGEFIDGTPTSSPQSVDCGRDLAA